MLEKMKGFMGTEYFATTEYGGISGIYFNKIIDTIIKIGGLDKSKQIILDYGAGHGIIKSKLFSVNPSVKVINYDIKKELTEVDDWRDVTFNTLIANQVFMYLEKHMLEELLIELKSINKSLEIIVGISKQSVLNNIGKYILLQPKAHDNTILEPKEEISTLLEFTYIDKHISVWGLADVYKLRFK
jgi:hypothetical protein